MESRTPFSLVPQNWIFSVLPQDFDFVFPLPSGRKFTVFSCDVFHFHQGCPTKIPHAPKPTHAHTPGWGPLERILPSSIHSVFATPLPIKYQMPGNGVASRSGCHGAVASVKKEVVLFWEQNNRPGGDSSITPPPQEAVTSTKMTRCPTPPQTLGSWV